MRGKKATRTRGGVGARKDTSPDRLPRAALVRRAQELNAAGWLHANIAAELRISRSYASMLLADPTGKKERARKARYSKRCPGCGGKMYGQGKHASNLCAVCAIKKRSAGRRWTPEAIVAAFQAFNAAMGRPPAVLDQTAAPSLLRRMSQARLAERVEAQRMGLVLPTADTVRRAYGTWDAALAAAGLPKARLGSPSHRGRRRNARNGNGGGGGVACPSCGELVGSLADDTGWCMACTAELHARQ